LITQSHDCLGHIEVTWNVMSIRSEVALGRPLMIRCRPIGARRHRGSPADLSPALTRSRLTSLMFILDSVTRPGRSTGRARGIVGRCVEWASARRRRAFSVRNIGSNLGSANFAPKLKIGPWVSKKTQGFPTFDFENVNFRIFRTLGLTLGLPILLRS
jgi:hypothetical protein